MGNIYNQQIRQKIYNIRNQRVILDSDLASLYQVETKSLNLAVRRNIERFPADFMFQLTEKEYEFLRFQIETSKTDPRGGRRYLPYVFTEQGVAMLSTVLRSKLAVQMNIEIMRAFVKFREILGENKYLAKRLNELEKKYDVKFKIVFDSIRQLIQPQLPANRRKIGFKW